MSRSVRNLHIVQWILGIFKLHNHLENVAKTGDCSEEDGLLHSMSEWFHHDYENIAEPVFQKKTPYLIEYT